MLFYWTLGEYGSKRFKTVKHWPSVEDPDPGGEKRPRKIENS
jgi:hypothetical protein